MEQSIYKYILRHSLRQQVWLTVMAGFSFPFLYAFYELPKLIINEAVQGDVGGGYPIIFLGRSFDQTGYLFVLCGIFLALVLVNQGFKYYINVYRGLTGERMLRRLRYQLFGRVLRFPLPTFRNMSQGEIIPMITAEVEPLGGFVGEAFSLPAFQGGTLLVILGFLFVQNWMLALAAVALYPIQLYLIPRLQRRVNLLGKRRVQLVRRLSERIGEAVQGVQEVHAHDTSQHVLADFSFRLWQIFDVRYSIYLQKFFIKFVNNFIQQLGPFFFYSIGGYFVIVGELQIGTLMAAIAAHKDLAAPWKEILAFYQRREDARIKYEQVVSQFQPAGLLDEALQSAEPEPPGPLRGEVQTANLTLTDDHGDDLVEAASLRLTMPLTVALAGAAGSGKSEVALLLARLLQPSKGRVSIAGHNLAELPEAVTGRRLAYIGQQGFIFAATLGDNLYYGLRHRPLRPAANPDHKGPDGAASREIFVREAEAADNSSADIHADWLDYEAAGVGNAVELRARALEVLKLVGLDQDVYRLGLRGTVDPRQQPELANAILRARAALRQRLAELGLSDLVDTFERSAYNSNTTMGENLLFGNTVGDAFDMERLAEHPYVLEVLDKVGLTGELLGLGYDTAMTMAEIFADVPPEHELFQRFSFIAADELADLQNLLSRLDREHLEELETEDRVRLLSLPFKLIPARHRLGMLDDETQARLLEARAVFARDLPAELKEAVEFFDLESYNSSANLQDNILFGKVVYGQPQAAERIGALITELITELELYDSVIEVGLKFDVGIAGSRLSAAQRQKLAIARCVMKRPDLMIVNEATAALDTASQGQIMENLLAEFRDRCLFWVLHRPDLGRDFDRIFVLRGGRLAEEGSFDELDREGSALRELMNEM
jgi:ABC-type multidrug transport system fused ATPase/permease subunit